jgi:type II secretory pathway pseudopilin PulG
MSYLIVAGLLGLLGSVLLAMLYRHNANINKIDADYERNRAALAEQANTSRQQLDKALQTLHETHREETIDATNPTHLAARDDFANAWSGDDGLHRSETDSGDATGATAADSTGAAAHHVSRTDLSK